jgi:hypothetical protein
MPTGPDWPHRARTSESPLSAEKSSCVYRNFRALNALRPMGKVSRLGLDATYNYHVLCCTDLSIDTGIVLNISEFARSQRKGKMSFETGNAKRTERKKKES